MSNNRLVNNRAIIQKLAELVEKYPNQRFTQLLFNAAVTEPVMENGIMSHIESNYNEESFATWKRMTESPFCFPPNSNS